jgi:hypothetical protein
MRLMEEDGKRATGRQTDRMRGRDKRMRRDKLETSGEIQELKWSLHYSSVVACERRRRPTSELHNGFDTPEEGF